MTEKSVLPDAVAVEADFQNDLRLHFLSELVALGAEPPKAPLDVFSVCAGYFNLTIRLIPKRVRRALKSRELLRRALSHRQRSQLGTITKEIETGVDLRPRLSRTVLRPDYNDRLIQDWRIHHLHVGPRDNAHGPDLLYVYVTATDAHLIDWQGHGVESFADQSLMQVLHDNWPEVLEHEKPFGFVPGSLDPAGLAPSERQKLRAKFTLCTQMTDGTIYLPIGGGTTAAGGSAKVLGWVQYERQLAQNVQNWVTENPILLRNAIEKENGKRLTLLRLRYLVGQPLRVREEETSIVMTLPQSEGPA